jgi:hypothetical protein
MPEAIAAGRKISGGKAGPPGRDQRAEDNAFHPGLNFVVDKFSWIQNSVWIERLLEPTM